MSERSVDLATFAVPDGWTVDDRGSGDSRYVVMSTGRAPLHCAIAVFSSAAAGLDLADSFAREWTRVALPSIDAVPTPRPAINPIGALQVAIGGATSTSSGQPVVALLVVADAGSRVVSSLVVTSSFETLQPYRPAFDAFLASLTVRRATQPREITPAGPAPRPSLTVAALAGEWGRNDGINVRLVNAHTGAYTGTDSIHFTETWSIGGDGTITLDFFGIQNGRRIAERITARLSLSDEGVLTIEKPNPQRFVLRGWVQTPEMTVMTLNGPWYEGVPQDVLADPGKGVNLDQKWVRLRH